MHLSRLRTVCVLYLVVCATAFAPAQEQNPKAVKFPFPEKLTYHVEWRLITAGNVTIQLSRASGGNWETDMNVESAGLVTRWYKVIDKYKAVTNQKFCGLNSNLDAQEGKHHKLTLMNFDVQHNKVEYDDHDVLKNTSDKRWLDVPPCTYETVGALASLRLTDMQPGKWTTIPITDGKKFVYGKIQAQARESLNLEGKSYQTVRYEAFLFDNVLYKRKGRLFIWLTDDAGHVPVQLRFQMGFPIGNITVELDKQQILGAGQPQAE
jgi:hypothetical protein